MNCNATNNATSVAIVNPYHLDLRRMYICICKAVTDADIREAAETGVADLEHLTETLGVGDGCGTCLEMAEAIIDACRAKQLAYAA